MKAWIRIIDEEDARGNLEKVYSWVKNSRGSLSNVMKVHSLDPESIRLHMDLYLHLMYGKSTLTRLQREMIAVVVSQLNNCAYCATHHREALLAHSKEPPLLENFEKLDFKDVSVKNRAILEYAGKLTQSPGKLSRADVDRLRTAGLSDEEILRINLIVSYFNFVNRIVSGLGVSLEDKETRVYKY